MQTFLRLCCDCGIGQQQQELTWARLTFSLARRQTSEWRVACRARAAVKLVRRVTGEAVCEMAHPRARYGV